MSTLIRPSSLTRPSNCSSDSPSYSLLALSYCSKAPPPMHFASRSYHLDPRTNYPCSVSLHCRLSGFEDSDLRAGHDAVVREDAQGGEPARLNRKMHGGHSVVRDYRRMRERRRGERVAGSSSMEPVLGRRKRSELRIERILDLCLTGLVALWGVLSEDSRRLQEWLWWKLQRVALVCVLENQFAVLLLGPALMPRRKASTLHLNLHRHHHRRHHLCRRHLQMRGPRVSTWLSFLVVAAGTLGCVQVLRAVRLLSQNPSVPHAPKYLHIARALMRQLYQQPLLPQALFLLSRWTLSGLVIVVAVVGIP